MTTILNILFVSYNTDEIRLAKYKFKRENQTVLPMVTDGEKWHYLALKSFPALLRGVMSNQMVSFNCLNCFRLCSTKKTQKT